uniref:Aldo/keto reductase n=1 Tax=Desulfobacca acetoxidans TaxID=60893 RepID=A0A7C3UYN1_9BACT
MRYLTLGKTGLRVSEVGFGGIPIIRLSMEEAVAVLRRALERGVTLFDTANLYMDSEDKFGRALAGERRRLVLATKSIKRDRAGVEADIHQSLTKMRTDYLDLFQFHQVSQEDDLKTLTGPGGALEGVLRAKEAGKIRHVGVTSHSLEMAQRLVKMDVFETIQFPFNFVEEAAATELFPAARQANLGILAMKPFCGGLVDKARVAFAYLRQYPDVIPLAGWDTVAGVDEVLDLYDQENVVTQEDQEAMARYRKELGDKFCRRCEYCQPCPQGVLITPAMLYGIVAHRMGPAKAAEFAAKTMETVKQCIQCGECESRCPYGLPIAETIQHHLALFEEHCRAAKITGNNS